MNINSIDAKRWIEIRDEKDVPRTEEELCELVAFTIKCHGAMEEQAYAQRKKPTSQEMARCRVELAERVIAMTRDFDRSLEVSP